MDDKVKQFCHKYEATAGPSRQLYRRAKPVPYQVWLETDPRDYAAFPVEDVAMVDITMPEDRFRALLEHDSWIEKTGLENNGFFNNNVMRVSNIIIEHERECGIRETNPAVKRAWERYQLLLHTVKDHYR